MPKPRHLRNAPIREAILDVRTPRREDLDISLLGDLCKALPDYPVIQDRLLYMGELKIHTGPDVYSEQREVQRDGFRAVSEDGNQIAQFRLDGFSFSRMRPYTSWPEVESEARRLWELYAQTVAPQKVTRLAVRYVNHLRIPFPVQDLKAYLQGIPDLPEGWPQNVSSFLYRNTLLDPERGLSAHVTLALTDDVDQDKIGLIFDIDAFVDGEFPLPTEEFWGTFGSLRDLKNRVFFNGVTEKTLEAYE